MSGGLVHEAPNEGATNIWLTPPALLAKLGPFDLDPCAAPEPRPWPTASVMVSEPADGLALEWSGRVWLNPPYGPHTATWLERLALHGRGTALIFARTETATWHDHIWRKASGVLFLRGRLRFFRPDGTEGGSAGAPSALVSFGWPDAGALRNSGIPGHFIRLTPDFRGGNNGE